MEILNELVFDLGGKKGLIQFGIPATEGEREAMFSLRYMVYSEHKYFLNEVPGKKDIDQYDGDGKCVYFIAHFENKIIGTARLIKDNPLPTEKECFEFATPRAMEDIPQENRAELGRLIVDNSNVGNRFPRHLVMLFLLKTAADYSKQHGIRGGYSFIKAKLEKKLEKLKIPFHKVFPYRQIYPTDGLLGGYFSQEDNPVIPIYFITDEIKGKLDRIISNRFVFKKAADGKYALRKFLYEFYLKLHSNSRKV